MDKLVVVMGWFREEQKFRINGDKSAVKRTGGLAICHHVYDERSVGKRHLTGEVVQEQVGVSGREKVCYSTVAKIGGLTSQTFRNGLAR